MPYLSYSWECNTFHLWANRKRLQFEGRHRHSRQGSLSPNLMTWMETMKAPNPVQYRKHYVLEPSEAW